MSNPTVRCPACGTQVTLARPRDERNQPMMDRALQYPVHSGAQWGQTCPKSWEVWQPEAGRAPAPQRMVAPAQSGVIQAPPTSGNRRAYTPPESES